MVKKYQPLIVIALLVLLCALALRFMGVPFMHGFMGLFFVMFSMFKFFDLPGFVKGFAMYDLVARRERRYGYAYPFMELTLGLLYLSGSVLSLTYLLTILLMGISGAGVVIALKKGMDVRCACLGTTLNVPLSTVSVVENLGMGLMALFGLAGLA